MEAWLDSDLESFPFSVTRLRCRFLQLQLQGKMWKRSPALLRGTSHYEFGHRLYGFLAEKDPCYPDAFMMDPTIPGHGPQSQGATSSDLEGTRDASQAMDVNPGDAVLGASRISMRLRPVLLRMMWYVLPASFQP